MRTGWTATVTRRETQVLDLIRDHRTNAEIAAELHLSTRTVESHVRSLLRKSGADDRRWLARTAEADSRNEQGSHGVRSWSTPFVGRRDLLQLLPALMSSARRSPTSTTPRICPRRPP